MEKFKFIDLEQGMEIILSQPHHPEFKDDFYKYLHGKIVTKLNTASEYSTAEHGCSRNWTVSTRHENVLLFPIGNKLFENDCEFIL